MKQYKYNQNGKNKRGVENLAEVPEALLKKLHRVTQRKTKRPGEGPKVILSCTEKHRVSQIKARRTEDKRQLFVSFPFE
jgi:hypothetical protein